VKLFIALVFDLKLVGIDPTVVHGLADLLMAAAVTSTSNEVVGVV
jgi:hypothetical protein